MMPFSLFNIFPSPSLPVGVFASLRVGRVMLSYNNMEQVPVVVVVVDVNVAGLQSISKAGEVREKQETGLRLGRRADGLHTFWCGHLSSCVGGRYGTGLVGSFDAAVGGCAVCLCPTWWSVSSAVYIYSILYTPMGGVSRIDQSKASPVCR